MNRNSLEAYDVVKRSGAANRKTYYDYALSHGIHGVTDDEVMRDTDIDHHAVGRIRKNLMALGALRDTGRTRLTRKGCKAAVWEALPGVDVTQPVPKSDRDELLKLARRKIKAMTNDELRAFVETGDAVETPADDLYDLFAN